MKRWGSPEKSKTAGKAHVCTEMWRHGSFCTMGGQSFSAGPAKEEGVELRNYRSTDCAALAELFYQTVHTVNARDYSKEQLDAWATGKVNLDEWNRSFLEHHTIVAVADHEIAGFGDMDASGFLDRLFVQKDHQGEGIGTAICDALEQWVQEANITTHASLTARPFFESRGYRVVREQTVVRGGSP